LLHKLLRGYVRIGWIPAIAAVVAIAATIALGNWQMRRAGQKLALQETTRAAAESAPVTPVGWDRPESLIHHRLRVAGTWLPEAAVYLDNRPYRGRAGFYLLMPLRLDDGHTVLIVNRGWLPRDPAVRTRIAPYRTPPGKVTIVGTAWESEPMLLELGAAAPGRLGGIWQNFHFESFRAASGLTPVPLILRQQSPHEAADSPDGLVRDWPDQGDELQSQIDRHRGYAAQWYGLAALTVFLTLFYGYRNARK
jgi:cytochrome oxidase assembly protein ShyY1